MAYFYKHKLFHSNFSNVEFNYSIVFFSKFDYYIIEYYGIIAFEAVVLIFQMLTLGDSKVENENCFGILDMMAGKK